MDMMALQTLFTVTGTICLGGAFLLLSNADGMRSRQLLAGMLIFWGAAFAIRVAGLIAGKTAGVYDQVLPPWLISAGAMAAITLLLWPMEIVRPGWLTIVRFMRVCLPLIVADGIYLIAALFGCRQFDFPTITDFIRHIGYFTTWWRLVLCAVTLGYILYLLRLIWRYVKPYDAWIDNNYSSGELFEIKWLWVYSIGTVVITAAFFANLIFPSVTLMFTHNLISGIFFAYIIGKALSHRNPYPERYFSNAESPSDEEAVASFDGMECPSSEVFDGKVGEWKVMVEKWMLTERPWLRADFKLADVMARFPLNRTYASRVFNEGFGKSFNAVVRDCRMEEAERLMRSNPGIPMSELALRCGYSTPQSFHRVFASTHGNISPGAFAKGAATGKERSKGV